MGHEGAELMVLYTRDPQPSCCMAIGASACGTAIRSPAGVQACVDPDFAATFRNNPASPMDLRIILVLFLDARPRFWLRLCQVPKQKHNLPAWRCSSRHC